MELSQPLLLNGIALMRHIINEVKQGKKFDMTKLAALADDIIKEITNPMLKGPYSPAISADPNDYPMFHSLNVASYAALMSSKMGYKGEQIRDITLGAILHDIGKINTPDQLRWKQEGVDEYENVTISEHPKFGAHWIGSLVTLADTVSRIISEHHERFDGKGYPSGLSDPGMSQEAKIISICNTYDFLVTALPEKPAVPPRDAMFHILKLSGKKFNPKIVQSFLNTLTPFLLDGPLYQLTSLVLLDTKEVAAVMKVDSWGDINPEIVVLTDSSQKKLARPLTIDLKKDSSRKIVKVLKTG